MAKTTVSQWDATAANNTDINSIPIDGAVTTPSQVDNIVREMMAQIKTFSTTVVISAASTDNALARFNGTSGAIQNSAIIIDDSNNVTGVAALTCTTFTSTGIDDNATGERVQIANTITNFGTTGADYNLAHADDDQIFVLNGGNTAGTGGRLLLVGPSHASFASDIFLTSDGDTVQQWDESAALMNFPRGQVVFGAGSGGTPTITFTSDIDTGFYSFAANEIGISTGGAFRGNVTSSGINLGKSAAAAATVGLSLGTDGQCISTVNADTCWIVNRTGSDGTIIQIRNDNSTVGTIEVAGAATNYNTSSDGRRKKNLRDFNSGGFIDALEVWLFDWVTGGSGYGVIAQDAHKVFPDAISHDEQLDLWTADYSKFVPLLLAEIKALRARVAALEA